MAKLLDQSAIEVTTSEIELEGWSFILSQSFKNLRSVHIAWRIKSKSPDQETSFVEADESRYEMFFEALRANESIRSVHVRAKQDGEPFTEQKMQLFFKHLKVGLMKPNLQELKIVELKMEASSHLSSMLKELTALPNKVGKLNVEYLDY